MAINFLNSKWLLLALLTLSAVSGCCCQAVPLPAENHCPTDARSLYLTCGEEAVRRCPCGPDQEYYGLKPTCWRTWPEGWGCKGYGVPQSSHDACDGPVCDESVCGEPVCSESVGKGPERTECDLSNPFRSGETIERSQQPVENEVAPAPATPPASAPEKQAPAPEVPAKKSEPETTPLETTSAETAPVKQAPAATEPAELAPTDTTSTKSIKTDTAPAEPSPAAQPPAEDARKQRVAPLNIIPPQPANDDAPRARVTPLESTPPQTPPQTAPPDSPQIAPEAPATSPAPKPLPTPPQETAPKTSLAPPKAVDTIEPLALVERVRSAAANNKTKETKATQPSPLPVKPARAEANLSERVENHLSNSLQL